MINVQFTEKPIEFSQYESRTPSLRLEIILSFFRAILTHSHQLAEVCFFMQLSPEVWDKSCQNQEIN